MSGPTPAVAAALLALRKRPDSAAAWNRLGVAFRASGNWAGAAKAFGEVVRRAPSDEARARWVDACLAARDPRQAHGALQSGPVSDPGMRWRQVGDLASAKGLAYLAADAYEAAVQILPDDSGLRVVAGMAAVTAGEGMRGLAHLEHAVVLAPDHVESWAKLCVVQEICGQPEAARASALRTLALQPAEPHACLVLAKLHRSAGAHREALKTLEGGDFSVAPDWIRVRRHHEEGQCWDRMKDEAQAFAGFVRMNEEAERRSTVDRSAMVAWRSMVDALGPVQDSLLAAAAVPWSPPEDGPPPVFLAGFPRSGTTLLEYMLGAHPGLHPTDETPAVDALIGQMPRLLGGQGVYPAILEGRLQDPVVRAQLRAQCRQIFAALRPGLPEDRRVIDKMPFSTVHVALISALFPDAHFLCIHRDPRDTALSCFMQDFIFNGAMGHMMRMDDIVDVQRAVFGLWRQARPAIPIPVQEVHYESLVDNPEATVRRLIDGLGLPWSDGVMGYRERLGGQHISTPSYNQVNQKIYGRAAGRWHRYTVELAPWRDALDHNAALLGYGVDGQLLGADPSGVQ